MNRGGSLFWRGKQSLPKTARTSSERLRGTVNRWDDGAAYRFIIDEDGTLYYTSRNDLPRNLRVLTAGTVVSFNSTLAPAPGQRYLWARMVRVEREVSPARVRLLGAMRGYRDAVTAAGGDVRRAAVQAAKAELEAAYAAAGQEDRAAAFREIRREGPW